RATLYRAERHPGNSCHAELLGVVDREIGAVNADHVATWPARHGRDHRRQLEARILVQAVGKVSDRARDLANQPTAAQVDFDRRALGGNATPIEHQRRFRAPLQQASLLGTKPLALDLADRRNVALGFPWPQSEPAQRVDHLTLLAPTMTVHQQPAT